MHDIHLPELPKPSDRQRWAHLYGSLASLIIANAGRAHGQPVLVITRDSSTAQMLEQELLFYSSGSLPIMPFPDWETLPYDSFSPHRDIVSDRLLTLHRLTRLERGIVIVPIQTLLQRIAPRSFLAANSLVLDIGQRYDIDSVRRTLESGGYRCVDSVYEHGEFAVRGSVVDLFPMGSQVPYRIELFDDEIESLRLFDAETQRTIEKVDQIRLLPAREFPLDEAGIAHFRQAWHEQFDVDHRQCHVYNDVSQGIASAGIEYFLPLFFDHTDSLLDYLPQNTLVFTDDGIVPGAEHFWQEVKRRHEDMGVDPTNPLLPPQSLFLGIETVMGALRDYSRIDFGKTDDDLAHVFFEAIEPPALPIDSRADAPLSKVDEYLKDNPRRVLFCAESDGRREALLELLRQIDVRPESCDNWEEFLASDAPLAITRAPIERGAVLLEAGIEVIAESQLFGQRVMQRRRRKQSQDNQEYVIKNLTELRIGAPVVHSEHGVGRYLGLESLQVEGEAAEYLTLEYAGEAKLYVPVASLHLISRYAGADEEHAPLHRLGSEQWQKAKRKAAEKIRDVAAELLDIYARRAARSGNAFDIAEQAYQQFAAGFPFEETADQESAIAAVLGDMKAKAAMDRLVCGDVGFGKTEVAMRAAFVAVHNGKQVAILVPTTLLAQQHFESFRDRFSQWPVNVEVVSRFRSNKEIESVKDRLQKGEIDILIGTHKLLQSDVRYKDLGLLIIDEEHRFGVRQKETLKSLRSEVDILALTATPIPRTLNMAMSGMRDLSIIATPPARRLSVKTFVRQRQTALIKEAILREILRGGQVYVLHNEVKSIDRMATELKELVPEARIGIGHGQMPERELEQVMRDFYHKRFNILLCTTIIETGIDVPSANTIIIERADKFGLAQLHQLRGRVGRSHHQAYAYLLTPHKKAMTTDAIKRLEAIEMADDLGAGFTLATHDLEIRGAGELLGDEQSGQIQSIGFTLYMEMLEQAVEAMKKGKQVDFEDSARSGPEINLRVPALIPEDYLPDINGRLTLYKRIAAAKNNEALRELQVEMIDRFGLLPPATKQLFRITGLKLQATAMGIDKIEANTVGGVIEFSADTSVEPLKIVRLVQEKPASFRLDGATQLRFSRDMSENQKRIDYVEDLLAMLAA